MTLRRVLREYRTPLLLGGAIIGGAILFGRSGRRSASLVRFRGWEADPEARCGIRCAGDCRDDFVAQVHAAYLTAGASSVAAPLLTAHSSLATGFGRCVWNFNIGVIRATPGWIAAGRPWIVRSTVEAGAGGVHFVDPRARWRAYDRLAQSAHDVLVLLAASGRYRAAWDLLQAGDVNWFAELGRAGYYTEPVDEHLPRYVDAVAETTRRLA